MTQTGSAAGKLADLSGNLCICLKIYANLGSGYSWPDGFDACGVPMFAATFRFLFGLAMAALAAAVTTVLFVITPADILALPPDARFARLETAAMLITVSFTQSVRFAFVFAAIAAIFGAMLRVRSWPYFVFAGLAISLLGYAALYAGEPAGQPTIANSYALSAYTFAGLIGGYVYWLVAGAGRRRRIDDMDFTTRGSERGDGEPTAPSPAPPTVEVEDSAARPSPVSAPMASRPVGGSGLPLMPTVLEDIGPAPTGGPTGLGLPDIGQGTRGSTATPAILPTQPIEPVAATDRPIRRPVGEIAQRFAPAGSGAAANPQQPLPTPTPLRVPVATPQRPPAQPAGTSIPAAGVQPARPAAGTPNGSGHGNGNGGSVPRTGVSPSVSLPSSTPPGKPEKS